MTGGLTVKKEAGTGDLVARTGREGLAARIGEGIGREDLAARTGEGTGRGPTAGAETGELEAGTKAMRGDPAAETGKDGPTAGIGRGGHTAETDGHTAGTARGGHPVKKNIQIMKNR